MADSAADRGSLEEALGRCLGEGVRGNAFRRRTIAPAASGKFALLRPLARQRAAKGRLEKAWQPLPWEIPFFGQRAMKWESCGRGCQGS